MLKWIVKNKFIILFAVLGLIAGFILNKWANSISEKKIIAAIIAEIETFKNKRVTAVEQNRLIELQAQLAYLIQKNV